MALISSGVQRAPRPTIRYKVLSQARRSCRGAVHIVAAWHWAHLRWTISLPGGAGAAALSCGGVLTAAASVVAIAATNRQSASAVRRRNNIRESLQQTGWPAR